MGRRCPWPCHDSGLLGDPTKSTLHVTEGGEWGSMPHEPPRRLAKEKGPEPLAVVVVFVLSAWSFVGHSNKHIAVAARRGTPAHDVSAGELRQLR